MHHKATQVIEPWDIAIGGHKLPGFTKEEIATLQAKAGKCFGSRFKERVAAQKQNIETKYDADGVHEALLKHCWPHEIEHICGTATYRRAELLRQHQGN